MSDNLPTRPGDPMAEFKAKLEAKVREDIAELLPETAVAELVKKAVEDVFFAPRVEVENRGSYHERRIEKPSWFIEAVAKEAKPLLDAAVNKFVAEHQVEIDKAVAEYLTPQNLTVLAVGSLSREISIALGNLNESIMQHFNR